MCMCMYTSYIHAKMPGGFMKIDLLLILWIVPVSIYLYMHTCVCVCVCVYIYDIHIHVYNMYIHTYICTCGSCESWSPFNLPILPVSTYIFVHVHTYIYRWIDIDHVLFIHVDCDWWFRQSQCLFVDPSICVCKFI